MVEHTVTYVPVRYPRGDTADGILYKDAQISTQPDPASLWTSRDYENHFRYMWQDGWDLVNVQPLLQGHSLSRGAANRSYGYGFSITAGYYFFWKRTNE